MTRKDVIFYGWILLCLILVFFEIDEMQKLGKNFALWLFFTPFVLLTIAKYTIHSFAKWLEKPIWKKSK